MLSAKETKGSLKAAASANIYKTEGRVYPELSSSIFHGDGQLPNRIQGPLFLWNVFPLHLHERGDPQSNQCHSRIERNACRPLLSWPLQTLGSMRLTFVIQATVVRAISYRGSKECMNCQAVRKFFANRRCSRLHKLLLQSKKSAFENNSFRPYGI